jgi:hypothetical protein
MRSPCRPRGRRAAWLDFFLRAGIRAGNRRVVDCRNGTDRQARLARVGRGTTASYDSIGGCQLRISYILANPLRIDHNLPENNPWPYDFPGKRRTRVSPHAATCPINPPPIRAQAARCVLRDDHAEPTVEVSRRLREDYDNGGSYYGLHGSIVRMPAEAGHHRLGVF